MQAMHPFSDLFFEGGGKLRPPQTPSGAPPRTSFNNNFISLGEPNPHLPAVVLPRIQFSGLRHLRKTRPPLPPPCPTFVHEIFMPSYRAPFETSEYHFSAKVISPFFFFYELLKFYSKELVSGLSEFFSKKIDVFFWTYDPSKWPRIFSGSRICCPKNSRIL